MYAIIDRLRTLKVSHVMAKQVVPVAADETLQDVAREFLLHDISSAPVLDKEERCVGMLSAADYLKREGATPRGSETAGAYMSSPVTSIAANASLLEAARAMCAAHVHRLPVLDGNRVVGIVSTMDIVAAVLNAVDELDSFPQADY